MERQRRDFGETQECKLQGKVLDAGCRLSYDVRFFQNVVDRILDIASQRKIDFVGHRVVHGGELFRDVTEITEESFEDLKRTEGIGSLFYALCLLSYIDFCKNLHHFTILCRSMSSNKQ